MRAVADVAVISTVESDYAERGVRLYPYKLNHLIDLYAVLRKWEHSTGRAEGHASWHQLVQQLYDDVPTRDDALGKISSVRNWARELQRLGLVTVREHRNERGQSDGIWWALASDAASARSSAGSSVGSSSYRRRPESRQEARERRIRPHCRRSGRQGIGRYVDPSKAPALFFSSESFYPHSPRPLKGAGGVLHDVTRAALAVDTTVSSSGAPPAVQGSNAGNGSTAPETSTAATRTPAATSDRAAELAQALAAFERRFGRPSLPLTPQTFKLYGQAANRGDLYGGFGRRQPGLSVGYVIDRIDAWTGEPRRPRDGERGSQLRRPAEPRSLAYFVALLDDASKHWRHAYRHHHGLCRRPELCRSNAWMYAGHADRIRNGAKWVAYDRERDHVRRMLNDAGYSK